MKVLIVLAHPERLSFNGGLADGAADALRRAGHDVDIDDLYGEGFDPVERASWYGDRVEEHYFSPLTEQRAHYNAETLPADVQREIDRLRWADLVIFQFPLWWHKLPGRGGVSDATGNHERSMVFPGDRHGKRITDSVHRLGRLG